MIGHVLGVLPEDEQWEPAAGSSDDLDRSGRWFEDDHWRGCWPLWPSDAEIDDLASQACAEVRR